MIRYMFNLIVAGSRTITDEQYVSSYLDMIHNKQQIDCVITGMCPKGPDIFAYRWAKTNNISVVECPANWNMGKSAGHARNTEMATKYNATHSICFWDGKSKGTDHMIHTSKTHRLVTTVVMMTSD